MIRPSLYAAVACAAALAASPAASAQTGPYHVVRTLNLGHNRADYIIVDPAGRRLYGLGDNVIDVDRDTVVGHVQGGGGG